MVTVKDAIQEKAKKAEAWETANPGREYALEYAQEAEKIYIEKALLKSAAYLSLSKPAMLVYQLFLEKREMTKIKRNKKNFWKVTNNGAIIFPYAEAEKEWGIPRSSFVKAIDELQRKGFIDITHQGNGGRKPAKGTGDYTTYAIDTRWKDFDEERGVSRIPPKHPRKKDERHRGFRIPEVKQRAAEKKVKYRICTPIPPMEYRICTPISEFIETENQ